MAQSRRILVTGATGRQGGAVVRQLLARGHHVAAMTRKPDSPAARELARLHAEIVQADLDDEASLAQALKGVWATFAVQNTWEAGVEREEAQGKRFARVAREAGVERFVYSSVGSAHRGTGIPHFENKRRVEETVTGLAFPASVVLRPVFFMENFLSPAHLANIAQGRLVMGIAPETVLQMIAVEDIGRYGAWALENADTLNGRAFDIAGDQHTMPETAEIIGQAAGRKVEFVRQPIDEIRRASMDWAVMLEWFDREGYEAEIEHTAREAGIRPTRLERWARHMNWAAPAKRAA